MKNAMPKTYKALGAMAYLTLILAAFLIGVVAYWLFYPYKTIELTPTTDFEIVAGVEGEANVIEQGRTLSYAFAYEKYTDVIPDITRNFVDGIIFQSSVGGMGLKRGSGFAIVEVRIPRTLPPGRYYLEITREFHMNPLRTIIESDRTEAFTVIEREP